MLCQRDLLFVIPQLQVCDIILLLNWWIINASVLLLLFPLLLVLLNLLRCLLRLPSKILSANLPTQDTSLGPVSFFYAQGNLLEDKFRLFSPLHRPKGLDLQFA